MAPATDDIDEAILESWAKTPTVNPKTGKKIKRGGPLYTMYKEAHDRLMLSRMQRPLNSDEARTLERVKPRAEAAISRIRSRQVPTADCVADSTVPHTIFQKTIHFQTIKYKSLASDGPVLWKDETEDIHEHVYDEFRPFLRTHGLLLSENTYDQEWIHAQMAYIKSLPKDDLRVLNIYCGTAEFYKIVNRFLRSPYEELTPTDRRICLYAVKDDIYYRTRKLHTRDFYDDLIPKDILAVMERHKNILPPNIPILQETTPIKECIRAVITVVERMPTNGATADDDTKAVHRFLGDVVEHLLNDVFFAKTLRDYTRAVQRIVRAAPPVSREFTVYRGINDLYHQKGSKKTATGNPVTFTHDGLVSTSLSPYVASDSLFMSTKKGHMLRIRLLPNTRCMILFPVSKYPTEMEILLPHGSTFAVMNGYTTKYMKYSPNSSNRCLASDLFRLYVTDMVAMPHKGAKSINFSFSSNTSSSS